MEEEAEIFKEPEVVSDSKETESSRHNRTDTHINSLRLLTACRWPSQVKTRQKHGKEKLDTKFYPWLRSELQWIPAGKGKIQFSSVECHSRTDPMPRVVDQCKRDSMCFVCFLFCFGSFVLLILFVCFDFSDRDHEVGWVGKWEESARIWGKGKNMIKIHWKLW